jgi:hypothetical protein
MSQAFRVVRRAPAPPSLKVTESFRVVTSPDAASLRNQLAQEWRPAHAGQT